MLLKYIAISNEQFVNLLNILIESVDEYHLFIFEKSMSFKFFDEQVLNDKDLQDLFVEIIKDRLANRDKFYIVEKYKDTKIAKAIEKGFARREKNEINEISCIDYFIEKIRSFVVLKNAQKVVTSVKTADSNMSIGLIEEKDLNNIKGDLYHMLNELTFDADFGEMELDDFARRERDRATVNVDKIVPTFSSRFNTMLNGGAYPSKLYFVAAPPGFGKSLFLCNIGYHALLAGKNVYHFTLEMGSSEVMQRYDCLFSKRSMIDVVNSPLEALEHHVRRFIDDNNCYLLLKEFPPESLTKDMLSMYLKRKIMTNNRKPDLIIVDYADLMKSSVRNTERRADLGVIYRQLKALAAEFQCPVWTASQINREGFKATESDMSNLSESWEKAQIADLVLVARQSKEEFNANRLRLYVAKNRSGQARMEIPCKIDYRYMKIEETNDADLTSIGEFDIEPNRNKDSEDAIGF